MIINHIIDGICKQGIVLPEFQREYVWSSNQAKMLFSSLIKEYPIGSLLFWKTDNPPELKNIPEIPDHLGLIQLILDGQQRLTTLYMLITGEIPPYYTVNDIKNDPRDLYFNLDTCDFQYYTMSIMKDNPLWLRVVNCFTQEKKINVIEIAKRIAPEDDEKALNLAQKYTDNLSNLRNIQKLDLPLQIVPSSANLTDAIDIFDLVNSQGTKLSEAELALTHITGKWAQARRIMKKKIDDLKELDFSFDLSFMTRAMTVMVTKRALYETIHSYPKEALIEGWEKLSTILDYLVNILPHQAFIHSTSDMSTTNLLIPIIAYLSINGGKFPDEKNLKRALYFICTSMAWARYSGQTDQKLEYDVSVIMRENNPWDKLSEALIDQRGRIEVKPSDLEGRTMANPLYRITYIVAKSQGAVDWFNGAPLSSKQTGKYSVHSHHIFPTSLLYKNGYNSENHIHQKIVNEIANLAFLTAESNLNISNTEPKDYLKTIEEKYPGALTKQFVPIQPELWELDNFPKFLEARRNLIALKINEYFNCLIQEPIDVKEKSIEEIIRMGESVSLEFKSTLQWDMVHNVQNKALRKSTLKTIAAFLNSEGGTLLIGIEDNGNVCGLENDLSLVNNSTDKFLTLLNTLIKETMGGGISGLIKIHIETTGNKQVCVIDVERSMYPVYLNIDGKKEFYIRMGNTSISLDPEEAVNYISQKWG
ncbi:MAG: DUF262 domain-containing protein [Candidatus Cloacimonas sp.]|nr:DUF262 domain-containing protein [Candidatus Cloacimonas sp.]